jgi:ribonuclease VapC
VVAFNGRFLARAREAFDQYGRGRGHRAKLNFGDCMAYAVAKHHGVPLLYKGVDFRHTDIRSVLP